MGLSCDAPTGAGIIVRKGYSVGNLRRTVTGRRNRFGSRRLRSMTRDDYEAVVRVETRAGIALRRNVFPKWGLPLAG